MDKNNLADNLHNIEAQIKKHLNKQADEPTIVAVSKYTDADNVRRLHDLGIDNFGENRPDVFLEKYEELSDIRDEVKWHYIGNLQRRPVKKIINKIDYLHSLDRLSLAKEIQKRAEQPVKCFLQVNISGEDSKSGFAPDALLEAIETMTEYNRIQIIGLMTMAPHDAKENDIRRYFNELSTLQDTVKDKHYKNAPCTELSMGMSHDYPIAVSEGASYIRLGTAFFHE